MTNPGISSKSSMFCINSLSFNAPSMSCYTCWSELGSILPLGSTPFTLNTCSAYGKLAYGTSLVKIVFSVFWSFFFPFLAGWPSTASPSPATGYICALTATGSMIIELTVIPAAWEKGYLLLTEIDASSSNLWLRSKLNIVYSWSHKMTLPEA